MAAGLAWLTAAVLSGAVPLGAPMRTATWMYQLWLVLQEAGNAVPPMRKYTAFVVEGLHVDACKQLRTCTGRWHANEGNV